MIIKKAFSATDTGVLGIIARMVLIINLLLLVLTCGGNNTNSTVPVTGVSIKPSTTVLIGKTEQLVCTIFPTTSSNKALIWASGNDSIATVSSAGLITGLAIGITIVTVTTVDGSFTAQCEVTVSNIETGAVTDADGNLYTGIIIGNQEWSVENLGTTKYNDGTPIPYVSDSAVWYWRTIPGFCFYKNMTNIDSIKKYGALYNWYAVDTKKLAPAGWHVSTDADWRTLQKYLIANGYNWDGTTTGVNVNTIAKSLAATTDWYADTGAGAIGNDPTKNNRSGFSAFPGGSRSYDGSFSGIGRGAFWWCSDVSLPTSSSSYSHMLYSYDASLWGGGSIKSDGLSVRLVRN